MDKKTVIIDCDPGIDDAFALLYGFKDPAFDIKLISTVSGNVNVDKTTTNALGLVRLANADIKVVKGATKPLFETPKFADHVHGVSGLGNFKFQDIDLAEHDNDDVVQELYDTIMASEDKVYLVALGPFTNIARLFLLHPEVKENIELISIMGGGIKGGNATMAAEFNVFVDPEATKIMFDSGLPILMAGLDVTEKALFFPEDLKKVSEIPVVGPVLNEILTKSGREPRPSGALLQLNDVLALMALTHPEIFSIEDMYVDIELIGTLSRGWTLADQRNSEAFEPNVKVLMDLDYEKYSDLLLERLRAYE